MIRLALFIFFFFGLFFGACQKNPVIPPEEGRNPRNYDWVRDTLGDGSYQSLMQNMWASSPSDLYVVGHASTEWTGKIWHYNGMIWSDLTYAYVQAFQISDPIYFAPLDVFGFAQNDVWIVGVRDTSVSSAPAEKGFILHYGGGPWKGTWLPTANGHYSVGGISSSDLWVGSSYGQLFHYNGSSWDEYTLSDSITTYYIRPLSSTDVYLSGGLLVNNVIEIEYYHWNGSIWSKTDSRMENDPGAGFQLSFAVINGVLYSANYSVIAKRSSPGVWQQVFSDANARVANIASFSASNVFAMGTMTDNSEGTYHFDGTNWEKIKSLSEANKLVYRAWADQSEAFLLEEDKSLQNATFPRSYVLRGK